MRGLRLTRVRGGWRLDRNRNNLRRALGRRGPRSENHEKQSRGNRRVARCGSADRADELLERFVAREKQIAALRKVDLGTGAGRQGFDVGYVAEMA